jgi:dipeptidyl aminopeptidase/acylaminoacyl peptidase
MRARLVVRVALTCLVVAIPAARTPLAKATYPGTNGNIAFRSVGGDPHCEIWTMTPDGTWLDTPICGVLTEDGPTWSPDGKRFAFWANWTGHGDYDVWILREDGETEVRLTTSSGHDFQPSWSPDGSRIAFTSDRTGNWEVFVMNADGTQQRNITRSPSLDTDPAWSPDGSTIAFRSDREGTEDIYLVAPDGTNPTKIAGGPSSQVDPDWSPGGGQLAFASNAEGDYDIHVVDVHSPPPPDEDCELCAWTSATGIDRSPKWSPDGTMIAFTSERDGNSEIYLMDESGASQRNISQSSDTDEYLGSWQPVCDGDCPIPQSIQHSTGVALRLKGHLVAIARVSAEDGFKRCVDNGQVAVQRKHAGSWVTVRKQSTSAGEDLRIRLRDREGVYRARFMSRRLVGPDVTHVCRMSTSDQNRHRHQ